MSNVVEFPKQEEETPEPSSLPRLRPMRSSPSRPISPSCAARRIRRNSSCRRRRLGLPASASRTATASRAWCAPIMSSNSGTSMSATRRKTGIDPPMLKLIVGARLVFADGTPDILAYPQHRKAWGHLTRLLTVGKSRGEKAECILYFDDLLEHIAGLNLIVMPPARDQGSTALCDASRAPEVSATSDNPSGSPPACSIAATTIAGSSGSKTIAETNVRSAHRHQRRALSRAGAATIAGRHDLHP